MLKFVQLQGSSGMTSQKARAAEKAATLKTRPDTLASWVFAFCTLLMLASVVDMWSHWFEVMDSFGLYRAAGMLGSITGAALVVSWLVNTGND
jgi:hypothetical protein